MKLKALDTVHVSSVQADNILAGEEFEVGSEVGKELVDRGLAVEVGGSKADHAPKNKMKPAHENKGIISANSMKGKGK